MQMSASSKKDSNTLTMERELEFLETIQKIATLEILLSSIHERLDNLVALNTAIGGWVDQETIMRLTGLGKTKLYELRRANKVSCSTITGKQKFYKLSDFEKLLNYNENK